MDAKTDSPSNDEVQVLDVTEFFGWRSKMKAYLKKFSVWEIVVNPPVQPNKKTKTAAEKDNKISLKFLMDGLSSPIKESVKEYTSAKDIWFKLEEEYQRRSQEKEKEIEVKDENKGEKEEQASNLSEDKKSSIGDNSDDIEIPFT